MIYQVIPFFISYGIICAAVTGCICGDIAGRIFAGKAKTRPLNF
ncbi:MAG: hypothetical protein ABII75_08075 [Candidatus Omnitrophota bacterium]